MRRKRILYTITKNTFLSRLLPTLDIGASMYTETGYKTQSYSTYRIISTRVCHFYIGQVLMIYLRDPIRQWQWGHLNRVKVDNQLMNIACSTNKNMREPSYAVIWLPKICIITRKLHVCIGHEISTELTVHCNGSAYCCCSTERHNYIFKTAPLPANLHANSPLVLHNTIAPWSKVVFRQIAKLL